MLLYVAYLSWMAFALGAACVVVAICSYIVVARRGTKVLSKARDDRDAVMDHYHALTDGSASSSSTAAAAAGVPVTGGSRMPGEDRALNRKGRALYNLAQNYNQLMFFGIVGVIVFGTPRWTTLSANADGAPFSRCSMGAARSKLVVSSFTIARAEVAVRRYEEVLSALPKEHELVRQRPAVPAVSRSPAAGRGIQVWRR